MNGFLKNIIKWKDGIYKLYVKNGHTYIDYLKLKKQVIPQVKLLPRGKMIATLILPLNLAIEKLFQKPFG